ncbi:MAG: hypothetical protein MJ078_06925 [Clostridia bacterium]|nr:hypothetical protein [Clostridia bacterium]
MTYCVKDAAGNPDVKKIMQYRKEIRHAAKPFIAGITDKMTPYEALLTVYRRVIASFDYDGKGLKAGIDKDSGKEDALRSLHSALVGHKVVCAGYAVAMQYLLQSVGVVCGYVASRPKSGSGHAWNIVKLGKNEVYYLDATWGDSSNTDEAQNYSDYVGYDYLCVNTEENERNGEMRVPAAKITKGLETLTATKYNYFRYFHAYLTKCDEESIVNAFRGCMERDEISLHFRCSGSGVFHTVTGFLNNAATLNRLLEQAKAKLSPAMQKKAKKWSLSGYHYTGKDMLTVYYPLKKK